MTLLLHMIEHPECVGATGHVQVAPNCSWEPQLFDTYESRMLLSAQRAEMAISTVTTFDMTSRFGYMPVLPGPLNIWRMSMLTARPRQAGQKARPEDLDDALTTFGALLAGSKRSNDLPRKYAPCRGHASDARCSLFLRTACHDHPMGARRGHVLSGGAELDIAVQSASPMEQLGHGVPSACTAE